MTTPTATGADAYPPSHFLPRKHPDVLETDPPKQENYFHYYKRGSGESAFFRGGQVDQSNGKPRRSESAKLATGTDKAIKKLQETIHMNGRGGWLPGSYRDYNQERYMSYTHPRFPTLVDFYVPDPDMDKATTGKPRVFGDPALPMRLRYPIPKQEDYMCNDLLLVRPRGANMGGGSAINSRIPRATTTYDPDGPDGCGPWLPSIRQGLDSEGKLDKPSALIFDPLMEMIEDVVLLAGKKKDAFGRELRYIGADGCYHGAVDNGADGSGNQSDEAKPTELPCDETPVSLVASLDTLADAMAGLAEWTHYFTEALVEITIRTGFPNLEESFGPFGDKGNVLGKLDSYEGRWDMMEDLMEAIWIIVKMTAFGSGSTPDKDIKSISTPVMKYETIGRHDKDEDLDNGETRAKAFYLEIIKNVLKERQDDEDEEEGEVETTVEEARKIARASARIKREAERGERHEWLLRIKDLPKEDAAYETLFASEPIKRYKADTPKVGTTHGSDDGTTYDFATLTAGPPPNALCVRLHAAIRYTADALMACVSREFLTPTWNWPSGEAEDKTLCEFATDGGDIYERINRDLLSKCDEHAPSLSGYYSKLLDTTQFEQSQYRAEPLVPELHTMFQQARCFAWTFPDAQVVKQGGMTNPVRPSDGHEDKWKPFFDTGQQSETKIVERDYVNLTTRKFMVDKERTYVECLHKFRKDWQDMEPGIPPLQTRETVNRRIGLVAMANDPVEHLSHPMLEVQAPSMPMPRLWYSRTGKKLPFNTANAWHIDFYDIDNADTGGNYAFNNTSFRWDLERNKLEMTSFYETTKDRLKPIFVLKPVALRGANDNEKGNSYLLFDYSTMFTNAFSQFKWEEEWGTILRQQENKKNKEKEKEYVYLAFNKVCPPPPRRPAVSESVYNASLLSWMRGYLYDDHQVPDYTNGPGNPGMAMATLPSWPNQDGTPAKSVDSWSNHLNKWVEYDKSASVAVPNSNSIFCRLLVQWMTRSGLTRDLYVDANGKETVQVPHDRLHTAYPESWIKFDGKNGVTKLKRPDEPLLNAVEGYGLEFRNMVTRRAGVHSTVEHNNELCNKRSPAEGEIANYRTALSSSEGGPVLKRHPDLWKLGNGLWSMKATEGTRRLGFPDVPLGSIPTMALGSKPDELNQDKQRLDTFEKHYTSRTTRLRFRLTRYRKKAWKLSSAFQLTRAGQSLYLKLTNIHGGWQSTEAYPIDGVKNKNGIVWTTRPSFEFNLVASPLSYVPKNVSLVEHLNDRDRLRLHNLTKVHTDVDMIFSVWDSLELSITTHDELLQYSPYECIETAKKAVTDNQPSKALLEMLLTCADYCVANPDTLSQDNQHYDGLLVAAEQIQQFSDFRGNIVLPSPSKPLCISVPAVYGATSSEIPKFRKVEMQQLSARKSWLEGRRRVIITMRPSALDKGIEYDPDGAKKASVPLSDTMPEDASQAPVPLSDTMLEDVSPVDETTDEWVKRQPERLAKWIDEQLLWDSTELGTDRTNALNSTLSDAYGSFALSTGLRESLDSTQLPYRELLERHDRRVQLSAVPNPENARMPLVTGLQREVIYNRPMHDIWETALTHDVDNGDEPLIESPHLGVLNYHIMEMRKHVRIVAACLARMEQMVDKFQELGASEFGQLWSMIFAMLEKKLVTAFRYIQWKGKEYAQLKEPGNFVPADRDELQVRNLQLSTRTRLGSTILYPPLPYFNIIRRLAWSCYEFVQLRKYCQKLEELANVSLTIDDVLKTMVNYFENAQGPKWRSTTGCRAVHSFLFTEELKGLCEIDGTTHSLAYAYVNSDAKQGIKNEIIKWANGKAALSDAVKLLETMEATEKLVQSYFAASLGSKKSLELNAEHAVTLADLHAFSNERMMLDLERNILSMVSAFGTNATTVDDNGNFLTVWGIPRSDDLRPTKAKIATLRLALRLQFNNKRNRPDDPIGQLLKKAKDAHAPDTVMDDYMSPYVNGMTHTSDLSNVSDMAFSGSHHLTNTDNRDQEPPRSNLVGDVLGADDEDQQQESEPMRGISVNHLVELFSTDDKGPHEPTMDLESLQKKLMLETDE